jgi:thioredoxin reductase (NADPH)
VSPPRREVKVIGRRLDAGDHRLRDFLTRGAQPFEWYDAETPAAQELLREKGAVGLELPVLIDDGELIIGATVEGVAEGWGIKAPPARETYDLIVVGAGPAGLAAAVYAASDGLSTVVLERDVPGGQASESSMIENFFGFPEGIGGAELSRLAGRQAEGFGAELVLLQESHSGRHDGEETFTVEVAGGHVVQAPVVIAASGMEWRRLEVEGLEDLIGRGVYYGAGRSEAAQCGGDEVVLVGAGNSAGQAAMFLGNSGARVTMLVRGEGLGKSMSGYLVERIAAHPQIDVRLRTEVEGVDEDDEGRLVAVDVREAGGAAERLPATALFICIGGRPCTDWAGDSGVRVGPAGFVLTGPDLLHRGDPPEEWPLERDPLALETSIPRLFAAGDVRHGSTKRVGGAVGDGAMAVALAHRALEQAPQAGQGKRL